MLDFGSSRQRPRICCEFPEQQKSMAAADPSLLYKLLSVIYHHISPSTRDTADTQDKLPILYQFWYPSLSMGVFQQGDLFCVILSRWMGQKCGESIRIRGRGLTEISVAATLNSNRMSDELTLNIGEGSRSSRTDGGVPLIPTFWEQQVWADDRPRDEEEYVRRLPWILDDGLVKVKSRWRR